MNNKCTNLLSKYFLIVALIFILLPNTSTAQESIGIRVQPATIEERVDPGLIYSSVIRVTNLSSENQTYNIVTRNISRLSPTGSPIFAEDLEKTGFELVSWIKVKDEPITVASGGTKEVPFSIEVPTDATPGSHFGGIFFALTANRPEETGVGIGYQVGTIINLRISGETSEEAILREFRTDKSIYGTPVVTFMSRVENTGNTIVRPRGPLEVTDMFGKEVALLRMNDAGAAVLPNQERQFEIRWEGQGLVLGRYQALLGLVYGEDERKNISSTISFWVLPFKLVIFVVGALALLLFMVIIGIKMHVRRRLSRLQSASGKKYVASGYPASPFSRLVFIAIMLLLFLILFMVGLFIFFA